MYPHSGRRAFLLRWVGLVLAPFAIETAHGVGDQDQKSDQQGSKTETGAEKVYEPGGDVKPPKLVHYVEPQFSPSSKEAFVEGTVKISTVVTKEGVPTDVHITRGLNTEEDRTAVEALRQWRFRPGTKAGEPVNVRVTVEVAFHLL